VNTPTQEYRRVSHQQPKPLLKGIDARVNTVAGLFHRRSGILSSLREQAAVIESLERRFRDLDSDALKQELLELRSQFRRVPDAKRSSALISTALAAVREAANRQLGLRLFPVQVIGALALQRGCLAEMATGEGKTLTAGAAAVLFGWSRLPCHVLTVNDYLVQRDAEWLKPLFSFCGVTVGYVSGDMDTPSRRNSYACDVTYTTSKELLADFLRDRLKLGDVRQPERRLIRSLTDRIGAGGEPELFNRIAQSEGAKQNDNNTSSTVLRGLHTAIVDEADSLLIDEAVTPLIISTTHRNDTLREAATVAASIAASLQPGVDYRLDSRYKEIDLTPAGQEKIVAGCADLPGLWRGYDRRLELLRQSLTAREFFHRDKHYIVQEEKVVIVDEFTGRPMPQRTWREGMHQAIEAKEGLPISDPAETVARLSFQRFFRCFRRLSGMSGTAREAATELWQVYRLPVITIPTNRPCIRKQWPDRYFTSETAKWQAIADEVARVHKLGRPVLIGTRSVAASEHLATMLAGRGLKFRVLNAVRLAEEAAIIEQAGEPGQITIATNMAGRGTDIKLGPSVAELGGLHVIATERHESRRVDRQLFGRAARQGDPGSAQAFVSVDDELVRRYLPSTSLQLLRRILSHPIPGTSAIAAALFVRAANRAQHLAARQRAAVLNSDTWLDQALSFADGGGL
jgi:preprotein translocase subunit SecA